MRQPFFMLGLFALLACPLAATALPELEPVEIAGTVMKLPAGWQREQDEYSLILTENPQLDTSATAGLIAIAVAPGQNISAIQLADAILTEMNLPAQGFQLRLVDSRARDTALYRLHHLSKTALSAYLASFTYTDSASGALIHLFFSATDERFAELGGSMFPLVVFGGMDEAQLHQARREARATARNDVDECDSGTSFEVCLAERWFSPGGQYALPEGGSSGIADSYTAACERAKAAATNETQMQQALAECQRSFERASQILSMSHRTSMQILHNMNSGWCYRGEPGCY